MAKSTVVLRAQYAFDNSMSRGTIALIGWLSVGTFGFLFASTFVVWLAGWTPEETPAMSLPETVWYGLMRTLDSGTMGSDKGSWPFKLSMLWITLGGVFVVSTLIGVLNNGIGASVVELRKGRSRVIEKDHTVILNWSPHIFTILGELIKANANRKNACIVILAERDKVQMEDAIRDAIGHAGNTRIVCRSGSPMELKDLNRVAVQTSRSIIVLAEAGADDPDSDVIKAVLALTNGPNRRDAPYHITAEIRNPDNIDAARLVGRNELEIVVAGDLFSRVTVQTCRQSGLSVVHPELLDFGGGEIYFKHEPGLSGKTFGDALNAFEDSALIGLRAADGSVRINPPMSTVIQPSDKVIAISEDDDTIKLSSAQPRVQEPAIRTAEKAIARVERTLILGWNWKGARIVTGLDAYVAEGSTVTVLAVADDIEAHIEAARPQLTRQTISVIKGESTHRRTLESLALTSFDHVIVLCSDQLDPQRADSRVLVTLLHLRDIGEKANHDFSIVSEMLDVRNRALAEVTKADDFIVSDQLVSLMLSQVSENKELNAVFNDGSDIYIKPCADYVAPGVPVNFATVVESARHRGEIAIGYRIAGKSHDAAGKYGVAVNPKKSAMITFNEADKVIVIAED